jgi:hypothetical protein
MKQFFFTFVAVAIPLVLVGVVVYMFCHGIYTVIRDWQTGRELKQIRVEWEARQRSKAAQPNDRSPGETPI